MSFIFLLIIVAISLYGSKAYIKNWNDKYLSKEETTSINAVFIMLVFLLHSNDYCDISESFLNKYYLLFFKLLGNKIVCMFFFFSGYGLMYQYYKKKEQYVKMFLKNRFLITYIHFAVAVAVYLVLSFVLKESFTIGRIVLSFIGWESIGNSNWYVFMILSLYLIFYISMKYCSQHIAVSVVALSLIMFFAFATLELRPMWWYETFLAFPVGCLYFIEKDTIERFMHKNIFGYIASIILLVVLYACLNMFGGVVLKSVSSLFFSLMIVLFSMKVSIGNHFLNYCGKRLFLIYIFQRVPMIILHHNGLNNHFYFVISSLLLTIPLILFFDLCFKKIDRLLIK